MHNLGCSLYFSSLFIDFLRQQYICLASHIAFLGEVAFEFCEPLCKTQVTIQTCYHVSEVALSAPLFSIITFHSIQIKSKRLRDLIKKIKHRKERKEAIEQTKYRSADLKQDLFEKRGHSPLDHSVQKPQYLQGHF